MMLSNIIYPSPPLWIVLIIITRHLLYIRGNSLIVLNNIQLCKISIISYFKIKNNKYSLQIPLKYHINLLILDGVNNRII